MQVPGDTRILHQGALWLQPLRGNRKGSLGSERIPVDGLGFTDPNKYQAVRKISSIKQY